MSYVDDWKRLRDALNSRSKPRESTIAAPPPTKEALALAEPRIISAEETAKLANSLRNRRRFANCSVVGNDSSMRDASLGEEWGCEGGGWGGESGIGFASCRRREGKEKATPPGGDGDGE